MPKNYSNSVFVKIAQILFIPNTFIWLTFGLISLNEITDQTITAWVNAILMVGNVLAMRIAAVTLNRPQSFFYIFAWVVLIANVLLTITDQFAIFDLITLIIDCILCFILFVSKRNH